MSRRLARLELRAVEACRKVRLAHGWVAAHNVAVRWALWASEQPENRPICPRGWGSVGGDTPAAEYRTSETLGGGMAPE